MFRSFIVVVWIIGSCCAVVSADMLVLKDGQRLDGTVTEVDADTYVVEQGDKRVTVKAEDVEEWISGNTGPAAPLELKPIQTTPTEPIVATEPVAEVDAAAPDVKPTEPPTGGDNLGANLDLFTDPDDTAAKPGHVNASVKHEQPHPAVNRRRIERTERAAAFAVASDLVVTSAAVVVGGKDAQLLDRDGGAVEFEIVRHDAQLALLRVKGKRLMPLTIADSYASAKISGGGAMRVCGYTELDLFQPMLTSIPCTAESPANTKGAWTITADANPTSAGGPILFGNLVVGVHLATDGAKLDAINAVTLDALKKFLGNDAGKPTIETAPELGSMALTVVRER